MEGTEDLDVQVLKDSPAYGAWNVLIGTAGTGEALPSPIVCEMFTVVTSWAWWSVVVMLYNQRSWEVSCLLGGSRRRP